MSDQILHSGFSGCMDIILHVVTVSLYNADRAEKRRWQADWLIGIAKARCRKCGYEFSGREAIDPARLARNSGLLFSGSRQQEEEESADQIRHECSSLT